METNIVGRNVGVTDRFREYVTDKSEKIANLVERAQSCEVKVSRHNEKTGLSSGDHRVELTVVAPKVVVRAEASGPDKYVAFDVALGRLLERLRRAKDRRKVHRGQHRPISLREASTDGFSTVGLDAASASALSRTADTDAALPTASDHEHDEIDQGESPVVIRRKVFARELMTTDDALYYMELVGHDFYLFIDSETDRPSVVYRRKGWDYGVISLGDESNEQQSVATLKRARG